jgi:hypothetical protein
MPRNPFLDQVPVQEFPLVSYYLQDKLGTAGGGGTSDSASYADTASYTPNAVVTASAVNNVITFTKGDNSTFDVTVATGSGGGNAFPYTGSALITGSLGITGSLSVSQSLDTSTRQLYNSSNINTVNWENNVLYDNSNITSLTWGERTLYDTSEGGKSIEWDNRLLIDPSLVTSIDWNRRTLKDSTGNTNLDWSVRDKISTPGAISASLGFTGSLFGTASWATNAVNATNSTTARTASYVNTLNQNVTIGNVTSTPSTENTLNIYPPIPTSGAGEGGQILLAASGGLYSSASMLDTYQNQFRLLKGTNTGGSTIAYIITDLQTGNTQFVGAVTASAYSGLPNDYLYATRSGSSQTVGSAWANTDIIFNNVSVSKGISFNTSTGVASLTGGKVYRVTARLAWGAAASYNLQFSCYTSANVQIGPTTEIIQSSNATNNISDGTLEFIYAPGSNTDIKIRCTNNNTALSGETIRADLNTQFIIQQIA